MTHRRPARLAVIATALLIVACGRKGPPLPPLVKLPVAPVDLSAARRGDRVDLQLTVPATNTDNSRPANVAHVDVYALTAPLSTPDAEVIRRGTRVASVAVKSPKDPQATTDPEDPEDVAADVEPPEGAGLDQGSVARVEEVLAAVVQAAGTAAPTAPVSQTSGPLLGPVAFASASRIYVGVGVTAKGKRGPASRRVIVPLAPPPPAPPKPDVKYTETAVTVSLPVSAPASAPAPAPAAPTPPLATPATPATPAARAGAAAPGPAPAVAPPAILASRAFGVVVPPRFSYHVYEVPAPTTSRSAAAATSATPAAPATAPAPAVTPALDTQLTKMPVTDASFSDPRMAWGTMRCYATRRVQQIDTLTIESDRSPATCVTLVDTFPPAPPKGLNVVASGEGEINLIWDGNTEPDLDGYIVVRAIAPGTMFVRLTPMPIRQTGFRDMGMPGVRYIYAVQAIDKAGNISAQSERIEESAR